MNITKKDFEAIRDALALLPHGAPFEALPQEDRDTITRADAVMMELLKKRRRDNARTAQYIAERRKTNRNYAR